MTIDVVKKLSKKGVDLFALCKRELGNGYSTLFWEDVWCSELPLKFWFREVLILANIFLWRLFLNKIPTIINLDR